MLIERIIPGRDCYGPADNVAVGPARPSNFCYFRCFIIFVLILFIFYPRNILLYEWVPADSWLCSSIQLIPFPFRLVTWSAVCRVTAKRRARGWWPGRARGVQLVSTGVRTAHAW